MTCEHNHKKEINTGLVTMQKCMGCGLIREYNPYKKRVLIIKDPDLWSEWSPSDKYVDKFFE
jgi:hypothetical protein